MPKVMGLRPITGENGLEETSLPPSRGLRAVASWPGLDSDASTPIPGPIPAGPSDPDLPLLAVSCDHTQR